MAFDPSAGDKFGMLALNATTEVELLLDVRYRYRIIHMGKDASGNNDANSASSAWFSTLSSTITADSSAEDEKYELTDGASEHFGPGISKLYIVSVASADATIKIMRVGTPSNEY